MKIVLVCNQGVSTSVVAKKMEDAASQQDIDLEIIAVSDHEFDPSHECDIVLVGPQIKYLAKKIQAMTSAPVRVIEMRDYGMMNGKKIFEDALKVISEQENA